LKKFLEYVAEDILLHYDDNNPKLNIILPNKRSEVFLKNYLKEKSSKTIWLPEFYTTDEFIIKQSRLNNLDPILIYFELYKIHKALEGKKSLPIEDFLSWAPIMLSDFNDIDLYIGDAEHIFKHLTEAKAIQQWNLDGKPLTELQSNYISFYQSLFIYYTELRSSLHSNELGYKGMIYRNLCENIESLSKSWEENSFILVGFNALSKSEKEIFGYLTKNFNSRTYWDIDEYYINPGKFGLTQMEAGRFINELINEWNLTDVKWVNNILTTSEKEIEVHGMAKQISQVKFAGQQLINWKKTNKIESEGIDTAIVLSDENLLLPLLHSLPKLKISNNIDIPYNITMGYPLINSGLSRFVLQWLNLLIQAEEKRNNKYSTVNLINLINNPIVKLLINDRGTTLPKALTQEFIKINQVFLSNKEILNILSELNKSDLISLFDILLITSLNPDDFINLLIELMQQIRAAISKKEAKLYPILKEQLNEVYLIIKKTQTIIQSSPDIISLKALQKIFLQLFRRSEINLKGEPLTGIQIMGMLETRNLDFKNIILLSANEGNLPKASNLESFIPFDIRHDNKLPLPKEQNDIYAYHFYRLLQRAKNITIIYNTNSDKIGSGEKSRFILQLENELSQINKSLKLKDLITNVNIEHIPEKLTISISKNNDILKRITKKAESGFSPSALNIYRNCPLKFYFRELINLKEINKIEPDIEFNVFGNAIHEVLHKIYSNFIGKKIDPKILKENLSNVQWLLDEQFNKIYSVGNLKTGKNHLIYEVAKKYLTQFLTYEIQNKTTPLKQIIGLEEKISVNASVRNNDVVLKGYLDRIEKSEDNNQIRIIDYKTGKVVPKDLELKDWYKISDKQSDKLFQLLFYAYLYKKKYKLADDPQTGIYSLRMLSHGLIKPKLPDTDQFEDYLNGLISEIFDPSIDFQQTDDDKICSYCDFKDICNK